MVSEIFQKVLKMLQKNVLILVLVEDGLGVPLPRKVATSLTPVLILVLVEDGLGGAHKTPDWNGIERVLILVLVEDGLGDSCKG